MIVVYILLILKELNKIYYSLCLTFPQFVFPREAGRKRREGPSPCPLARMYVVNYGWGAGGEQPPPSSNSSKKSRLMFIGGTI